MFSLYRHLYGESQFGNQVCPLFGGFTVSLCFENPDSLTLVVVNDLTVTTLQYGRHVNVQFGFVPTFYPGFPRCHRPLVVDDDRLPTFGRSMSFRNRTCLYKRRAPEAASFVARRRHGFPACVQRHGRLLQPLQHAFHVIIVVSCVAVLRLTVSSVVDDCPSPVVGGWPIRAPPPSDLQQWFFFFGWFFVVIVRQQDVPDAADPRGPHHQPAARRLPAEKLVRVRVGRFHRRRRDLCERTDSCAPGTPTEHGTHIIYIIIYPNSKSPHTFMYTSCVCVS